MPRRDENVVSMRRRSRPSQGLPLPQERLGRAVRELDDLWDCIERIVRDPLVPTSTSEAALTRLRLSLAGARQSLAALAEIRAGWWPDTKWAVRFRAARAETERRMLVLGMSANLLVRGERGYAALADLSVEGTKLAEAVDELSDLITSQYPETAGDC